MIDLSTDSSRFADLDLNNNPYVLYSNISNDFSDQQLQELKSKWTVAARSGSWPVRFILYKKD